MREEAAASQPDAPLPLRESLEELWRAESRRVLATLLRLLGDLDLAEEALAAAFAAALESWERDGTPRNPRAWLISTGRFLAIDALRRRARFDRSLVALAQSVEVRARELPDDEIGDDQLRLIFACCHPALAVEAQIALTLREVCGLRTEEIARALLGSPSAIAQRIVRAKARLREVGASGEAPGPAELPLRLAGVQQVIYLVFNEGYAATSGENLLRAELSREAIRLGRLLVELHPGPEAQGLLALMLLHDARRAARTSADGGIVRIEEQDRGLWDRALLAEGIALVERALASGRFGRYTVEAAIAALHAEAPSFAATDWAQIVALYDLLLRLAPSPVAELNRAMALSLRDGPASALRLVEELLTRGDLAEYPLAHAAHAELLRQMERGAEARAAYERALALTRSEPERRFLELRREHSGA